MRAQEESGFVKRADILGKRWFDLIHKRSLIYNTCWEDPRCDRQALQLSPDDNLVVITSAGCNALDYVLAGAGTVNTVDMNPRQNALLELKIAGIRHLPFATFFEMFGRGRVRNHREIYETYLRADLTPFAKTFWDKRIEYFKLRPRGKTFYYHGSCGFFARAFHNYAAASPDFRRGLRDALEAETLEQQRAIYFSRLRPWKGVKFAHWIASRDATLALLGVPPAQRRLVEADYPGGIAQFIMDQVEEVFTELPLSDNYFWRVYLSGSYTQDCCPEYLRRDNFERLKAGLWKNITITTGSITEFLQKQERPITRFVLLDHMDWLANHRPEALEEEWQAIISSAAPNARMIWRSGAPRVDFVDPIVVNVNGKKSKVGDLLTYDHDLAARLHPLDRVHTYGCLYVAQLTGKN
jgi:S-adenosylmethionine-diacylglycerol 3-amino-3-carboxypropyl transferase